MPKRAYTDLSNLTPEERKARNAARMRERRAANPSDETQRALEAERARKWRAANPERAAAIQALSDAKESAKRAVLRADPNWRDGRRREVENMSPLGLFIDEQRRISNLKYIDLTVLTVARDPYRFDKPSIHRDSKWVGQKLEIVLSSGSIHIRGLHYRLVAHGGIIMPSGMTYINDPVCYDWLNLSVKSACWLGYVPFDRITDNRNDEPVTVLPGLPASAGWVSFDEPLHVPMPDFDLSGAPEATISGVHVPQPYRIILIGEKSSLREELEPIRAEVNAELILPTGELSDTLIYDMAGRAAADPRPSVVLYFSDFDPSGYNMPVSLSRKLQALKTLYWPDLEIQVHAAALDLETCVRLDLPSTPLKESEKRAANWQAKFDREQTEIDALLALHPGELGKIAREAVAPFFDFTLARRLREASGEWYETAEQVLNDSPEYQAEVRLLAERQDAAKATIREAIDDINLSIDAAVEHIDDIGLEFEPFEAPAVEITAKAPRPLFDSNETWVEQTRRLKERKALEDEDETP